MRVTVLGGCGAWPEAGSACSGYVVERDGFRLVLDLGYATMPRLPGPVDAVFISHGHPDHCADLNPLLRARAMSPEPLPPLPVYAPPGALDAVLALDRPGMLDHAYELHEIAAGESFRVGPFVASTRLLPHWVPNAGIRLAAGGRVLAYTGDCGPSPEVVALARDADLLIADATHPGAVPEEARGLLSGPRDAGRQARAAGVRHLLLTHLWPGADHAAAVAEAATEYGGPIGVATPGLVVAAG
ncbi:MBL fold metallo-hydrolase [Amorphoplanes nipponensis]|uniref:MBL fold metallo-hydrolase n=1 Tax=Actinoplanes nipponensis TaxID=135950 RepID=A0A919JEG7_9ACTN|nr:MBL fold metallo-hydrolase [Actinoplanes nipponensis]GIE47850.1 MBL fold metallo-hydrolase [Actinoplanes nipponensis]